MNRRHHRLVTLVSAGLLVLVSCSSKESGSGATSAPDETPPPSTAPGTEPATSAPGGSDAPSTSAAASSSSAPIELTASDVGVTADTVTIAYLYPDLRQLVENGLVDDVIPLGDQLQPLVDEVNASGGINGRTLEVNSVSWDPMSFPASLGTACTQVAQDAPNLLAFSPSFFGDGAGCLAGDHGVPLLTMSAMAGTVFSEIEANTFLFNLTFEEAQRSAVVTLDAAGAFDGLKLGAIVRDEPGGQEAIEAGLRPALEAAGHELAEVVVIAGTGDAAAYSAAVQRLKGAGVTGVFVTTNTVITSGILGEADRQGFTPQWFGSDQSEFTVDPAEDSIPQDALDGARGVTFRRAAGPASADELGPELTACLDARSTVEPALTDMDEGATNGYLQVCAMFDVVVDAMRAAGADLTRAAVVGQLEQMDSFPLGTGGLGSFGPGQHVAPLEVRPVTYAAACRCWEPSGPFVPFR